MKIELDFTGNEMILFLEYSGFVIKRVQLEDMRYVTHTAMELVFVKENLAFLPSVEINKVIAEYSFTEVIERYSVPKVFEREFKRKLLDLCLH